ncbi:hypothetical protein ACFQHO_48495 [Actinomadura yumaensis]|uniref:hypothetical protein n=1 Tax=Actinomadura yumaensis TaxID=111807 RepID=UPI00360E0B2C
MTPLVGAEAADSAYADGPVRPATRARTSPATVAGRPAARARRPASRLSTARTVAAATAQRSHGCQSGVRSSRANAQAPVIATAAGGVHAHAAERRYAPYSRTVPAPVRAAMAGAIAVV